MDRSEKRTIPKLEPNPQKKNYPSQQGTQKSHKTSQSSSSKTQSFRHETARTRPNRTNSRLKYSESEELTWVALLVELLHVCKNPATGNQISHPGPNRSKAPEPQEPPEPFENPAARAGMEGGAAARTGGERLDHAGPARAEVPEHVLRRAGRAAAVHVPSADARRRSSGRGGGLGLGFWGPGRRGEGGEGGAGA